jgi:hypothetical protein
MFLPVVVVLLPRVVVQRVEPVVSPLVPISCSFLFVLLDGLEHLLVLLLPRLLL